MGSVFSFNGKPEIPGFRALARLAGVRPSVHAQRQVSVPKSLLVQKSIPVCGFCRAERKSRLRGRSLRYCHRLSRVIDRRFRFGREERALAFDLVRKPDAFFGLRGITDVLNSNPFHLVAGKPDRDPHR
jgi:hypothetical protein